MGIEGEVESALQSALAAVRRGDHKYVCEPGLDFLMHFSAAWVYTTMATIHISILEKQKRYAEACELLRILLGEPTCPFDRSFYLGWLTPRHNIPGKLSC